MSREKGPFRGSLLRYSHLGVQFALIIALAILGGRYLDQKLGTGGLLVVVGVFAGAGIGFYVLLRELKFIDFSDSDDSHEPHGSPDRDRGDSHESDRRD